MGGPCRERSSRTGVCSGVHSRGMQALDPKLARVLGRELDGEVRTDPGHRLLYATDASIYRVPALGVVHPRHAADVRRALEIARDHGVPILARGAGTSLSGQTVAEALVLDCSTHLRAIDIDPARRRAVVGPGAVLDLLNARAAPHGLMFGPDVATSSRATLGGMIANNSCGAHSIVYGKTVDHVEALEVALASGEPARAGWVGGGLDAVRGPLAGPARVLADLVRRHRERIIERYPALLRRVAGYNLDAFLEPPFNLARILVGSEGTLAVTTEATLALVPKPVASALVLVAYADLFLGIETVPRLLAHRPAAIELTDRVLLDLARTSPVYARIAARFLTGPTPGAVLAVAFHGDDPAVLARRARELADDIAPFALWTAPVLDAAGEADFWELRKGGLGILMAKAGDAKPIAFVEDAAVDPVHLADYLRGFDRIVRGHGLDAAYYAHASVGVIHARPVIDLKNARAPDLVRRIGEQVAELALGFGGSVSGEHGDGRARTRFLEKMYGPELIDAFRELKRAFDPRGLLNADKIVGSPDPGGALRIGPEYRAVEPPARFDWSAHSGLARAVEHCNGNALCRKGTGGAMCPSYRATRVELHGTRGRANLLREAISGGLPDGLLDRTLHEALDTCLGCKACLAECPSSVDMTRMKHEVQAERHRRVGVPLAVRLMSELPRILRAAWPFARLQRWVDRPGFRVLAERAFGIDRRRSLPVLATRPASIALAPAGPADGRPVALYLDTFTNYFDPDVAGAALLVLARAGCRVTPIAPGCCGRIGLSLGIPGAGPRAADMAERLGPWLDQGVPIVGLEPSCLLTLRDEVASLAARDLGARVRRGTFLFEEYLAVLADERGGAPPLPLAAIGATRALLHPHCHQRALSRVATAARVLGWIPDLAVETLDAGCCGMAGQFGYQHYDLSRAVGELALVPRVRARADGELVVAAGTSCRHQLHDLAGVRAHHPAQLLARASLAAEQGTMGVRP